MIPVRMKRATKTFTISEEIYNNYQSFCKKKGEIMSRKIEEFMVNEMSISDELINPLTKKIHDVVYMADRRKGKFSFFERSNIEMLCTMMGIKVMRK